MTPVLPSAPHLVIEGQDRLDAFEATGRPFFSDVLALSWDACLLTDGASLSDFAFSGMPEGVLPTGPGDTLNSAYDVWDAWVIPEIERRYRVTLGSTAIPLVDLFARIESAVQTSVVH